jgi:shikimate kinase
MNGMDIGGEARLEIDKIQTMPVSRENSSRDMATGNLLLTGLPAAGKSTIGRLTAQVLGLGFIDLDEWIETQAGESVSDIFRKFGEDGFRKIEEKAIHQLKSVRNHVIALGSGAIESDSNWFALQRMGAIGFLDTPLGLLSGRLARSAKELERRPLFKDLIVIEMHEERSRKVLQVLEDLWERRSQRFLGADVLVLNGFGTPEFVAQSLARELRAFWQKS